LISSEDFDNRINLDSAKKITLGEERDDPSVNLVVLRKNPVMFIKKNSTPGPSRKENQKEDNNGKPEFASTIYGSHG